MGLLDKANVKHNVPPEDAVHAVITRFCDENPLFHCIILQAREGEAQVFKQHIVNMMDGHGSVCVDLHDRKCLVLMPGALDRELFTHRLSHSTASVELFQLSSNSTSFAFDQLSPYLS